MAGYQFDWTIDQNDCVKVGQSYGYNWEITHTKAGLVKSGTITVFESKPKKKTYTSNQTGSVTYTLSDGSSKTDNYSITIKTPQIDFVCCCSPDNPPNGTFDFDETVTRDDWVPGIGSYAVGSINVERNYYCFDKNKLCPALSGNGAVEIKYGTGGLKNASDYYDDKNKYCAAINDVKQGSSSPGTLTYVDPEAVLAHERGHVTHLKNLWFDIYDNLKSTVSSMCGNSHDCTIPDGSVDADVAQAIANAKQAYQNGAQNAASNGDLEQAAEDAESVYTDSKILSVCEQARDRINHNLWSGPICSSCP